MARIRYIKPDFFKDEDIAELPYETRLFYIGLWGLADKQGRLKDRPKWLKAEIFPYDNNINTEAMLEHLAKIKNNSNRPFILRYEIDNEKYIQILSWHIHQRPHHTEKESSAPEPPQELLNSLLKEKERTKEKETMETEKEMEKEMETENQLKRSRELRNGEVTVKAPLINYKKIQEFVDLYHTICTNLPKMTKLNDSRKEKIRIRLKEEANFEKWKECFQLCNDTPFLRGENKDGWKASLDWLVSNDTNYLKVLEGNYKRQESENENAGWA